MTDPGGGTEEHRSAVLFGIVKSVLNHPVGILRGGRVKDRDAAEFGKYSGVLLRL